MKKIFALIFLLTAISLTAQDSIKLPQPEDSHAGIEEVLRNRRSHRLYTAKSIPLSLLSQLLWAGQGITKESGQRTAPSAVQTYPIEIYVVVEDVDELENGLYKYDPTNHSLVKIIKDEDLKSELAESAREQESVKNSKAVLVIVGDLMKMTTRFDELRGNRYMAIEAGAIAQNIYLQATAIGIGTVLVGSYEDDGVIDLLNLSEGNVPILLMPIGMAHEE